MAPISQIYRRGAPWAERRDAIRDVSGVSVANGFGQVLTLGSGTEEHALGMSRFFVPVDCSRRSERVDNNEVDV